MNILVQLVHPAHFYYYRNILKKLDNDGHKVFLVITSKDILEDLLVASGLQYVNILPKSHKRTKFGYLLDMLVRNFRILKICLINHIDLLTGSSVEITQIGWLLHKPAINIGEDDAHIVPKYTNAIAPFLDVRVTPESCDNGRLESKSVQYRGFLKLAYLHPNVFTPSKEAVAKYGIDLSKPYFVIRFSALKAHHDSGIKGIGYSLTKKIVNILQPRGNIFITSERELEPEFERFRLKINPLDIHHILAFATLYLGDSQSMANEAAMLGVPSIRFNDFVGEKQIGVLEEMESNYGLTFGIASSEEQVLLNKLSELLEMSDLKSEFQRRRQKMLSEKIDVSSFLTWFIENYPESKKIMKENPEYQYRFK